jgi:hypothetical protein
MRIWAVFVFGNTDGIAGETTIHNKPIACLVWPLSWSGEPSVWKFGGQVKFGSSFWKIQPKHSGTDGGTIKILKSEFWLDLLNYRPNSSRKSQVFSEIGLVISGRILVETDRIFKKIDHWKEKAVKNNNITSIKFIHANIP